MKPFGQRRDAEVKKDATHYANRILASNDTRFTSRKADDEDIAKYMEQSEARIALMLQKGLR